VRRLWALFAVLALGALPACGGGDVETVAEAIEACLPRVVLNEVARESIAATDGWRQRLRVELHNPTQCALESSGLVLAFAGQSVAIAPQRFDSGAYRVVEAVLDGTVADCGVCDRLTIARTSDGLVLDDVPIPKSLRNRQYAGRVPDGIGPLALQEASEQTLGAPNVDQGPVVRLTEDGGFPPRDSSPNAIVRHRGAYWMLGGWGNHGHDLWYSVSDVWKSDDAVNWTLVNASPPYSPYSAFVVYRGRIWALGRPSFSSDDGIDWRLEQIELPLTKRAVVFDGAIVAVVGERVLKSTDGATWTSLVEHAPWGPDRKEPRLLVHAGRLWLIGGTDEPPGGPLTYRNDVWSSADGIEWVRVTASAEWGARRWFNAISHAGMLWVLNGANYDAWADDCNNTADIWLSEDGARWRSIPAPKLWGARHASYVAPSVDGGFILAAGYGNCGIDRMYADVWRVEFRPIMLSARLSAADLAVGRAMHPR
jgi:hypothetical protein